MALDPDAWEELCRRRAAGENVTALAQVYGVSETTIRRRIADRPAKASPKKPAPRKTAGRKTKSSKAPTPKTLKMRKPAPRSAGGGVRRQLIARLYRAIDTKLKLMERRMTSEIDAIDAGGGNAAAGDPSANAATAGRSSADHERETRAFGALVKTINSVRQMQAELDTLANAHTASTAAPSAADARLAADAERYRRDIAQRLAKFVPPQP